METTPEAAPAAKPSEASKPPVKGQARSRKLPAAGGLVPTIVAIVVLLLFAAMITYLLVLSKTAAEVEWGRVTFLLNGVEAVAFAGAGYLFGREVHREQAKKAEDRADQAENKAKTAQGQATEYLVKAENAETRGRALASAILAKSKAQGKNQAALQKPELYGADEEGREPAATASVPTSQDLTELTNLAEKLFPGE